MPQVTVAVLKGRVTPAFLPQDFLSRYPITKHSWLGARRGPQGWYWTDGVPLPPQL